MRKVSEGFVEGGLTNPKMFMVKFTPLVLILFWNQSSIVVSLFNVEQLKPTIKGKTPIHTGVTGGVTDEGDLM